MLDGTSPPDLKKAFSRLFRQGMPEFIIIRCDRDKSLQVLANSYFAAKGILLKSKRSVHHLGFFEGTLRGVQRKFIQNYRKNEPAEGWTIKQLQKALKDATYNYNHTVSTAHGKIPADVNRAEFDPELRLALYGPKTKLQPFEKFYQEQLELRKKANTPETSRSKAHFDEKPDSYKKGTWVYLDYAIKNVGGRYHTRRGPIFEIDEVNTLQSPYLYRLKDIKSGKLLYGWYYGREIMRASLAELEVEKVLRRRTDKDGNKHVFVKLKGYDKSFNRWFPA